MHLTDPCTEQLNKSPSISAVDQFAVAGNVVNVGKVVVVGKVVQSLCREGACGTVLIKLERCVYLQFDSQLVCIGLRELGASAITGLLEHCTEALPVQLQSGVAVRLSPCGLMIDGRYLIDMSYATEYVSTFQQQSFDYPLPSVPQEWLNELESPAEGLAPLMHRATGCDNPDSVLVQFAKPAVNQLLTQVLGCCFDRPTSKLVISPSTGFDATAFQKLIGAGPGLTPSGDDFLCGVFAALYLLGKSDVASDLWLSMRAHALLSTTAVSFAILEQSARGESSERLDALMDAVITYPRVPKAKIEALISQIGQTSGWDWLTGFVLCLNLVSALRYSGKQPAQRATVV